MKGRMKRLFSLEKIFVLALVLALFIGGSAWAEPWKFGIISDTQWTKSTDPAEANPNSCAWSIIKQIDQQFIDAHVKLVIHVGDMVDVGSQKNDYTRALYAQDLYNHGIGFYGLRGNHEAAWSSSSNYLTSDEDLSYAYPQIPPGQAGWNNLTPSDITTPLIPYALSDANRPASREGAPFRVGHNFSYPTQANEDNHAVSYAFDYRNATFMLLDQFNSYDGPDSEHQGQWAYYDSHILDQQKWIKKTLRRRPRNTHAFAFTHKNLLGGNHKDNMFGGPFSEEDDPGDGCSLDLTTNEIKCLDNSLVIPNMAPLTVGEKRAAENTFLSILQDNEVKYMISGHDHHHYNSVVTSPDGNSKVHQLITQSDSSKFYKPGTPVSPNDTPVEQDLNRVGYYIVTVDGPRVTIDYYADDHGEWQSDDNYPYGTIDTTNYPLRVTPTFNFVKRSTFGYSLNGIEKLVKQGESYEMKDDTTLAKSMERSFVGTSMAILAGTNESTAKTNYGRPTQKAVNTGWAPAEKGLASDILTLWGMADLGSEQTDTYVLSMSFDKKVPRQQFGNGGFGIAARNADGTWVNAVDMNVGGTKNFVKGPWDPSYGLGTYGVDASTKTAWAVINHASDFAVATGIEPAPGHRK
jgi:hypothetical protein